MTRTYKIIARTIVNPVINKIAVNGVILPQGVGVIGRTFPRMYPAARPRDIQIITTNS